MAVPQSGAEASRSQRLRIATQAHQHRFYANLVALDAVASRENYSRLLRIHYHFHCGIAPLYRSATLATVIPDLWERRRMEAIERHFIDLHWALPADAGAPLFGSGPAEFATGLGWLYAAEKSALGAALLLLKAASGIGLDEEFGACHLADDADSLAQRWRAFTATLDAATLDEAEERRMTEGAAAAFAHVQNFFDTPDRIGRRATS